MKPKDNHRERTWFSMLLHDFIPPKLLAMENITFSGVASNSILLVEIVSLDFVHVTNISA